MIISEIQHLYGKMSAVEQQLARFILLHGEELSTMNITTIAKMAGVSAAAVTRFCQKIGCNGFIDFKLKVHGATQKTTVEAHDVGDLVYSFYTKAIKRSSELIDLDLVNKLVGKICSAKRVFLYGVGSSGLTAQEVMYRLSKMGFNALAVTDSQLMIITAANIEPDDLVICISLSGKTQEILNVAQLAKDKGAFIVAVTSIVNSSLTKLANLNCVLSHYMFVAEEQFINTQFSNLYFFDILMALLLRNGIYSQRMKECNQAISTIRYGKK